MSRRRRWQTLRGRLIVGLVAVLLLVGALTGIATALFLRGFLITRLDTQIAAAGGRYAASLEHPGVPLGDGDGDNAVPGQAVGTLGVRIAPDGKVSDAAIVAPDGRNERLRLTPGQAATLRHVRADGHPHSIDLHQLGGYRVQGVAGRDHDVQITGLPLHEVDETVARLGLIELALFVAVAALAGTAAAVFIRRTLRPLEDVAATALHVSDLRLTDAATVLPAATGPEFPTNEVEQVSVAFDRMLEHVRTALAARDRTEARLRRFVADASHELRTPLATIRAYAEYATRADRALPDPAQQAFDRIDAAAIRMTHLVDDLLLLARLDAGRPLAREPVDLTQVVVEAVADVRAAGPGHRWRLDLPDEPVPVIGDPHRLHQLVLNLLANARAHTPDGTTVTATLTVVHGVIRIEVADDGPGIPADQQEAIFDRFTRLDESRGHAGHPDSASSNSHASSGLGLAIARGIAAAHSATLSVRSRPGRTVFTIKMPAVQPAVQPADRPAGRGDVADTPLDPL